MRKKPFTDTEVLYTKSSSDARTSSLGDVDLGKLAPEAKKDQEPTTDTPSDPQSSLLQRATKAEPLSDREGLQRAYDQGDSYQRGDTLFVAGSHMARDWYDNFTKMPV